METPTNNKDNSGLAPGEEGKIDTPALSDLSFSNFDIKEEAKQDEDPQKQNQDFEDFAIDENDLVSAMGDNDETIKTDHKVEIKEEVKEKSRNLKKEGIIAESYSELQEKYKKLKEESTGKEHFDRVRLEHLKKMREKKIQERWMRALMHFGVEPDHYFNDKEKILKIYPFSDFNFIKAKKGEYERKKMGQVVLQLLKFEIISDTYNVECKVSFIRNSNYLGYNWRNNARNVPYKL